MIIYNTIPTEVKKLAAYLFAVIQVYAICNYNRKSYPDALNHLKNPVLSLDLCFWRT